MPAEPFTRENAKELGRQGGIASGQARRAKTAADRVREALAAESEDLVKVLLDAAYGRGGFAELAPKDRLVALNRCLEYGIGRPVLADRPAKEAEPEKTKPEGLVIE